MSKRSPELGTSDGSFDRQEYAGQGYALVPRLLDAGTVAAVKREAERFDGRRDGLGVQLQLVHRSALIRELATRGPHVPLCTQVLGPNVCFTHQQFVIKHPNRSDARASTDVPWHQDNGYGRLEPPEDLTVWIALDDCDERNGCLWVLPGSHAEGLRAHGRVGALRGTPVAEEGTPVPMRAGDALLFSGLLLHRSLPNETDRSRYALYFRYCLPTAVMVNQDHKPVLEDGYSWMVAGEAP